MRQFHAALIFAGLSFSAVAHCQTIQTPVIDFVTAQNSLFLWTDPPHDRTIFFDMWGTRNAELINLGLGSLGTTFSGTVTQQPQKDGGRLVRVELFGDNVYAYARGLTTSTVYMGYNFGEVLSGASPSVGSYHFSLVWSDPYPVGSSYMEDVIDIFNANTSNLGIVLYSGKFEGSVKGPLRAAFGVPDGTPGFARTTQIGLSLNPKSTGDFLNGFAATEEIEIKATGK